MRRGLFAAALIGLLTSGCAQTAAAAKQRFSTTFVGSMDTIVTLTAWCESSGRFDTACQLVRTELERLDALYNRYAADSALSRVNASAGGAGVSAPRELRELVAYCRVRQPDGGVNIAAGGLLELWHTARETGQLPDAACLRDALVHSRMETVRETDETLTIDDPQVSLDLGAVAKGDAADRLSACLRQNGVTDFLLDCGTSSLVCAGRPPDTSGWTVALTNPNAVLNSTGREAAPYLGTLELKNRCVGVSGDYQQYFVKNGTYYSHIIDPVTGYPATHYRMVCVLAQEARAADYYATALFVLPPAEALALAQRQPELEALWVLPDGTTRHTAGFPTLQHFAE